ncbi:MAG TPA: response regulator transcription factor [Candidatus Dormibacteraeota bacterium]|nr:response regulator transcription factor [Candidatus Dormibacteraeota bacterium]
MLKFILIVDDNPLIRRAVRAIFEAQPDFRVCGEAVNGQDAIEKTRQLHPDLIVLDCSMPVMNGLEAAATLTRVTPQVPMIMLTAHKHALVEPIARAAGICAILSKEDCNDALIREARTLLN